MSEWEPGLERKTGAFCRDERKGAYWKAPLGPGAVVTPLHRSGAVPCAGDFSPSLPVLSLGAAATGTPVVARANVVGESL